MSKFSRFSKVILSFIIALPISATLAQESDMSSWCLTNFEIKENGDGTYKLTSQVKIEKTYLTERSTKINYFSIHEPFYAKVSKIKGVFRNQSLNKRHILFDFAEFEDSFITEYKIHTLFFPTDIQPQEKLNYEYKQNYSDIAFLPIINIPNLDLLNFYQITFEHPQNHHVEFEFFFPRDTMHYTIDRSNQKKTIVTFENIVEKKPIKYFPFNDFHAAMLVTILKNNNPINPTSTKQFIKWYGKQINLSPILGEANRNILAEEFKTAKSDRQKLEIIHDFVRQKIRYIADEQSMYAFIPHQPDYIINHSYGDCKDRAYLAAAIAREEDINVFMALINTEPRPPFKGVHVLQYNHVICATALPDGSVLFFDPTHKYCEFGNLPEDDIGVGAFVLNPENPRIVPVPTPNELPSISLTITADINDLENCAASVFLRNEYFSSALQAQNELTGVKLENFLSGLISSNFYKISLDYFHLLEEKKNVLVFSATADLSKFIISSNINCYIPKTPFLAVDNDLLERSDDPYPLYLPYRKRMSLSIILGVAEYSVDETRFQLGDRAADNFIANLKKHKDNRIKINYEINQISKYLDAEDKKQFLEFSAKYLKSKKEMFILTGSKP